MVIDTTGEGSGGSALVGAEDELVVLLVEDDDGDAFLVTEHLADAALTVVVRRATTLDDAISTLGDRAVDCVLLDSDSRTRSGWTPSRGSGHSRARRHSSS